MWQRIHEAWDDCCGGTDEACGTPGTCDCHAPFNSSGLCQGNQKLQMGKWIFSRTAASTSRLFPLH